jgi:hypothetical protein
MTDDLDQKLGNLLRADAPLERDPLFRIGLIERSERQRYHRRQRTLLVSAVGLAVLFAVIIAVGAAALPRAELFRAGLVIMLVLALTIAALFSIRGVRQVIRSLRGS